jgi:hypothetical protein
MLIKEVQRRETCEGAKEQSKKGSEPGEENFKLNFQMLFHGVEEVIDNTKRQR